jgi:hypothetical protein
MTLIAEQKVGKELSMSETIYCTSDPVAIFGILLPYCSDAWKRYKDIKFPFPSNLEGSELVRYEIRGQAGQVHTQNFANTFFPVCESK